MAVGAYESLTRFAEAFQMHLMTDSVSRTGKIVLGNF